MKPGQLPKKIQPADVRAIQDLEQGKATADQQKHVLDFIINNICMTYHPTYGDNDRDSNFLNGRRFVGLEIINCLKLSAAAISRRPK